MTEYALKEYGDPAAALSPPAVESMANAYRLLPPATYRNFPAGSIASTVPDPNDVPTVYGLPETGVSDPSRLSTVNAATVPLPLAT